MDGITPGVQLIIRDEAERNEEATRRDALALWDQRGVEQTVMAGMEHIELTPELKQLMRTAAHDRAHQVAGYFVPIQPGSTGTTGHSSVNLVTLKCLVHFAEVHRLGDGAHAV